MADVEPTAYLEVNGTAHDETIQPIKPTSNEVLPAEIPMAKLQEIVVTDYIRQSLDKVALAEGFQNYHLDIDHGSSIGDGFVGIMLKVTIKEIDSDKSLTVLAKVPPASKARREQMKIMPIFQREIYVYNVMLPEFVEFQKEKRITQANGFFNFPRFIMLIMMLKRTTVSLLWKI